MTTVLQTIPSVERGRQTASLFPLPLTPFEHMMVADDRKGYPMAFVIELILSGDLDRTALDEALARARERHPLLNAVIRPRRLRWEWHPSQAPLCVEWYGTDETGASSPPEAINLRFAPGLRAAVHPHFNSAGNHKITFEFHHAATDGLGAMQFIGDVLAIYGQLTATGDDERPELTPLDPSVLRHRGQLWESGAFPRGEWKRIARRTAEFFAGYACGLAPGSAPRTSPTAPFVSRVLDRSALGGLKAAATRAGVTLNDICVAAMFRTLRAWNELRGKSSGRDRLRLSVPISLRTPLHDASPAANFLSYMFLTRRARDLDSDSELIRHIARESQAYLNHVDGRTFPFLLGLVQRIPGALELGAAVPFRFCTAVLANVGDVKRQLRNRFPLRRGKCVAGSLTLEALLGAAPTRPGTHLGASLGTYAGQFFVNFNCDPLRIAPAEAEAIADIFLCSLIAFSADVPSEIPAAGAP